MINDDRPAVLKHFSNLQVTCYVRVSDPVKNVKIAMNILKTYHNTEYLTAMRESGLLQLLTCRFWGGLELCLQNVIRERPAETCGC